MVALWMTRSKLRLIIDDDRPLLKRHETSNLCIASMMEQSRRQDLNSGSVALGTCELLVIMRNLERVQPKKNFAAGLYVFFPDEKNTMWALMWLLCTSTLRYTAVSGYGSLQNSFLFLFLVFLTCLFSDANTCKRSQTAVIVTNVHFSFHICQSWEKNNGNRWTVRMTWAV